MGKKSPVIYQYSNGAGYPRDNGLMYHYKSCQVCAKCRTVARDYTICDQRRCPKCQEPMVNVPRRMALPPQKDWRWEHLKVMGDSVFFPCEDQVTARQQRLTLRTADDGSKFPVVVYHYHHDPLHDNTFYL